MSRPDSVGAEQRRIAAEYDRRAQEIDPDRYAPWQAAEIFLQVGRARRAAAMLAAVGAFPRSGLPCLEVGCGSLGWLGQLLAWGTHEQDLYGIDLDPSRVSRARARLPLADLRQGDATEMPWAARTFRLVVASTVFTSILDTEVRRLVADEISRVLAPGGALLWYDFRINNPRNPNVRRVGRRELRSLFPRLKGRVCSVTLAPPLARVVVRRSWIMAEILELVPALRTHLLAVLVKGSE